ncbi:hypothetical protein PMAYCL1PPCAC_14357, partial [Pristionchus mayeri]
EPDVVEERDPVAEEYAQVGRHVGEVEHLHRRPKRAIERKNAVELVPILQRGRLEALALLKAHSYNDHGGECRGGERVPEDFLAYDRPGRADELATFEELVPEVRHGPVNDAYPSHSLCAYANLLVSNPAPSLTCLLIVDDGVLLSVDPLLHEICRGEQRRGGEDISEEQVFRRVGNCDGAPQLGVDCHGA